MNSGKRALAALAAVVGATVFATYFALGVSSAWNLMWMVGLPVVVTLVFYRRSSPWIWPAAFAWLSICSFCTLAVTAEMLGAG